MYSVCVPLQDFFNNQQTWVTLKWLDSLLYPVFKALQTMQSQLAYAYVWNKVYQEMEQSLEAVFRATIPADFIRRGVTQAKLKQVLAARFDFIHSPLYDMATVFDLTTPAPSMTPMPMAINRAIGAMEATQLRGAGVAIKHEFRKNVIDFLKVKDVIRAAHPWEPSLGMTQAEYWASSVYSALPSDDKDVVRWPCVDYLRPYASRLLAVVVNSAGIERIFKALKHIHNPKRNRLGSGRGTALQTNKVTALTQLYHYLQDKHGKTGSRASAALRVKTGLRAALSFEARAQFTVASFCAEEVAVGMAVCGDDDEAGADAFLDADDDLVGGPVLRRPAELVQEARGVLHPAEQPPAAPHGAGATDGSRSTSGSASDELGEGAL